MGSFMEDLWSSIFTPGPTPTLLVATNVTFAALQTVLFALLLATYSIHFVVLSVLSAALWASINWFAGELKQAQAQAEEEARKEKEGKKAHADGKPRQKISGGRGGLDNSDSDTETENTEEKRGVPSAAVLPDTAAASAFLQPPEMQEGSRKRHSVSGESSGYGSTDSEWEKVDEGHTS